jgi:type II secretory pathway component GspD/PulD (secretin)
MMELIQNIIAIEPETWDSQSSRGGMMGGMGGMRGGMGGNRNTISTTEEVTTGEGSIRPFASSRLIITQTPEVHEKIVALIEELRSLTDKQVSIEAKFIVVSENFLEDIGLQVNINRLKIGNQTIKNILQNSFDATAPQGTKVPTTLGGLFGANPAANPTTTDAAFQLNYTFESGDLDLDLLLRATNAHSDSRTLTAPRVTVISGEQASIMIQQERNYVSNVSFVSDSTTGDTGNVGNTVTYTENEISTLETGISMMVTPVITADNKYVILGIETEIDDMLQAGLALGETTQVVNGKVYTAKFDLPTSETSTLMTRVVVPDKGMVLLGGLTVTAHRNIEVGVPILSKIPFLGRFFSNRSDIEDKQVLLILVKPTIVIKQEAEEDAIAEIDDSL